MLTFSCEEGECVCLVFKEQKPWRIGETMASVAFVWLARAKRCNGTHWALKRATVFGLLVGHYEKRNKLAKNRERRTRALRLRWYKGSLAAKRN